MMIWSVARTIKITSFSPFPANGKYQVLCTQLFGYCEWQAVSQQLNWISYLDLVKEMQHQLHFLWCIRLLEYITKCSKKMDKLVGSCEDTP